MDEPWAKPMAFAVAAILGSEWISETFRIDEKAAKVFEEMLHRLEKPPAPSAAAAVG